MDSSDYKKLIQFFPPVNNRIENTYEEAIHSYKLYESKIKKYYKSYNKRIDLLYDIYDSTKETLNNIKQGIEFIHFTIKPLFSIKIPLEIIFKTFNSKIL